MAIASTSEKKQKSAAKRAAEEATDKVIKYNQTSPYAENLDRLTASVMNTPTLSDGKSRPMYENRYAQKLDKAINAAVNPSEFSYDMQNDPVYQSLAKTYMREGSRATQDALGKAAAVNGGALSTAGVQAGAQAGQYYSAQLADKIPALYEQAYARHMDRYKQDLNAVDLLSDQEKTEYGRHRDEVGDWERAEATDYDRKFDAVNLYRTLDNDKYSRLLNEKQLLDAEEATEYTRNRAEEETEYTRRLNEEATAYSRQTNKVNQALSMWQQLGYANREVAEVLGIPEGTLTSNQRNYNSQKTSGNTTAVGDGGNKYEIPSVYAGVFERAKKANDGSESGKEAALETMYNLAQADETRHQLSDDLFEIMLLEAGITAAEYIAYMKTKEGPSTINVPNGWQGPPAPGQIYSYNE